MSRDEIDERGHISGFFFGEHEMMLADGFEDCIVGVVEQFGLPPRVCYDKEAMLVELMAGGLDREDAEEFFSFNIEGAYVGEGTPCFLSIDDELWQGGERDGYDLHARVGWTPDDVLSVAPSMGAERAAEWLTENEKHIRDRLVELGFRVIGDLLAYDGVLVGEEEE